jgi:hypothetical protein
MNYRIALLTLALLGAANARAIETPLASFEPEEYDLTVTSGDAGLTVSRVPGGANGAPPATAGSYVLKLQWANEDHKVEFRMDWWNSTYDLAGRDVLLADVYIATASALPGLMGIWSLNWSPPDAWQQATGIPASVGAWNTISFNVSQREQTGLNYIHAFIFENMPGTSGVAYVDNLRFVGPGATVPQGLAINSFADRTELVWRPVLAAGLQGYYIYRSANLDGPFIRLNPAPTATASYSDPAAPPYQRRYYRVAAVVGGVESAPSYTVDGLYNGLTDEELLDLTQEAAFRYFWDFAHPVSGGAREGFTHWSEIVATGGTGMGLMAITVAAERGFITRSAAAARVLRIIRFFDTETTRYHGAWAHWVNGTTGATIPFSTYDNGGDLVETSYFCQGLLTVRRYFDAADAIEDEIRATATRLWEEVEWDWYLRYPGGQVLYWHWSPTYGWAMNLPMYGYMETMITYICAVASPTHPIPPSCYHNGWTVQPGYANGSTYYGYKQWVGPPLGGPLFFTHYSHLGFDPRFKRDHFCNYFENSRNISLIHQAYSIENPAGFDGYNRWEWGLTASVAPPPTSYWAHSPTSDLGTIAPTAALSAMPYTPRESRETIRYFFDRFGITLWGVFGFRDAFNETQNWFADTYLAIDQGPIVVMIENYRSQLPWRLFMSNPEIRPALHAMDWSFDGDLDDDGDLDPLDLAAFLGCLTGPGIGAACAGVDLDGDLDADASDLAVFQEAYGQP